MKVTDRVSIDEAELEEHFVRASGPGGQNVNKVSSAVQLRFDAAGSAALSDAVKQRLLRLAGRRATRDGTILIEARRFRAQERNRQDARDRLAALVRKALEPPPPPRKEMRPSRAAKKKRVQAKRKRQQIKRLRRPPSTSE